MAVAQSNRLLPIMATVVALMAIFVLMRACSSPEGTAQWRDIPQAPAPDVDSPAETIRTLSAQVNDMATRFDRLQSENEVLQREQERRERMLEREIARRVQEELARQPPPSTRGLDGVMERLERLSGRVEDLSVAPRPTSALEIPIGLGLGADEAPHFTTRPPVSQLRWIEPLGAPDPEAERTNRRWLNGSSASETSAVRVREPVARATQVVASVVPALAVEPEPKPVWTVPRNATMIGSTTMTALIGRIPRRGTVEDPMPFKIIQGRDNLAANGLMIPGVEGMVWSGTATGDWTLSCVRGRLDSVTFVFADGTIRTLPDHDPAVGPDETRDGTGDARPLGWLSDERGYPCISGERVTDAPRFLATRAGLMGLQAAAEAFAAGETTTTVNVEGTSIGTITGDQGRYIAGRTVAGGTDEVARWLLERQEQSFDAVVAAAGLPVTLHIDRELRIDYVPAPTGRRLSHENHRDHRMLRLD